MAKEKKSIFEQYYNTYAAGIFRFVYFKVSDNELAKDLTADVFVRFWKVMDKGDMIDNPKAFLYRIAHGIVIDSYRSKKNKKHVSLESVAEVDLSIEDVVEEQVAKKQQIQEIMVALRKIKQEYHDVLLLYYVEELEVSEIASVLHKKENSVRVLIHRALTALKTKL